MSISTKKLTLMAILTAIALIIFIIEAQIPLPISVPGVKLGLANVVTLFALFYGKQGDRHLAFSGSSPTQLTLRSFLLGRQWCCGRLPIKSKVLHSAIRCTPCKKSPLLSKTNVFTILLCRIILGAIFTGRPIVIVYSLAGGMLGFVAQVIMWRFVTEKQIWVCGAVGAVFHNIGQILAAMVITGTPAIITYLPVLVIAGILTGIITGLVAQFTVRRLNKV